MALRFKNLLYTIIAFISFCNLNAQNNNKQKLSMGIEIGPSLTTIFNQQAEYDKTNPAIGTTGGLTFQVFINRLISFRSSYLFQMKVENPKYGEMPVIDLLNTASPSYKHTNFYYIGIPILLQFNMGKKIVFFTAIGPNINLLFKSVTVDKSNDSQTKKSKNNTIALGTGITTGFGILIPLRERFAMTLEARNNFTLLPMSDYQTPKFYSLDFLIGFSVFNN